jgi:hypothetical protein
MPGEVTAEWSVGRHSFGATILPIILLAWLGGFLVFTIVGAIVRLPNPGGGHSRSVFTAAAAFVVFCMALGALFFCLTARKVTLDGSGRFTFVMPLREVVVQPGSLLRVTAQTTDWAGRLPVEVRARRKVFWLHRQIGDFRGLLGALAAANPDAEFDLGWRWNAPTK